MELKAEKLSDLTNRIKQLGRATVQGVQSIYIPLQGKLTTLPDEEPFDLDEAIQSFFAFDEENPRDPKVLLLLGDTGSGKSVFAQQMYQQLWKQYQPGDPLPLWISLPELTNPFENAVEEVLAQLGATEALISTIKASEKLILVVDGYDECHKFQNCFVGNRWSKLNAKILMTCRTQALYYQKDYEKHFMPYNGDKRLPWLLSKRYVAPFSKEQIRAYLEQYQALYSNSLKEEDLEKVPGLTELITTPFLLHLAVEALPTILAKHQDDEKITQALLYDAFFESWFTRQEAKLRKAGQIKGGDQTIREQFWDYSKRLAAQMHANDLDVVHYAGKKGGTGLFGKQTSNSWEPFFNQESKLLRSACPLKKIGDNQYGFLHASMIEYFAEKAMHDEIIQEPEEELRPAEDIQGHAEKIVNDEGGEILQDQEESPPNGWVHESVFTQKAQTIQFMAERIEREEKYKKRMLKIVHTSAIKKSYSIGAANAITGLVRAGFNFTRAELAGIRVSGANLEKGIFDRANLKKADLSKTLMKDIWLRGANVQGCNFEGVDFEINPYYKVTHSIESFDYREHLNLLAISTQSRIYLWDIDRHYQIHGSEKVWGDIYSNIQFTPDGKWILFASGDLTLNVEHAVRIWDVSTWSEKFSCKGHTDIISGVCFGANGTLFVSCSLDKTIRLWSLETQEELTSLQDSSELVCVAVNSIADRVIRGGADNLVVIWDIQKKTKLRVLQQHTDIVSCVAYSPEETLVASGSHDGTVCLWDEQSGKLITTLEGHGDQVKSVAFSPKSDRLVSIQRAGGNILVWEIASKKTIASLHGHLGNQTHVQFSSDGMQVITSSEDCTVRVWDIPTEYNGYRRAIDYSVLCFDVSDDGRRVILGNDDNSIRIWDSVLREEQLDLRAHKIALTHVHMSPDGTHLVSRDSADLVLLCNLFTGDLAVLLDSNKQRVNGTLWGMKSLAFSPNSQLVATPSAEINGCVIQIWDVVSHNLLRVLETAKNVIMSIRFSPDGEYILSGSCYDDLVRIWKVSTGKLVMNLGGYGSILMAIYSPDQKTIAVHTRNGTFIIDLKSEKTICHLETYDSAIGKSMLIQYIENGKRLMAGGANARLQIWDIESEKCIQVQTFSAVIANFFYHSDGRLILSISNNIECWQNVAEDGNFRWELCWSTYIDSPALYVEGLEGSNLKGISYKNYQVLKQHGANGLKYAVRDIPWKTAVHQQQGRIVEGSLKGSFVVLGSLDFTVRIYKPFDGDQIKVLRGHTNHVLCAQFSSDEQNLVSGARDKTARVWNVNDAQEISKIELDAEVRCIAISNDANLLMIGCSNQEIVIWNIKTNMTIGAFRAEDGDLVSVAITKDGKKMIYGVSSGSIGILKFSKGVFSGIHFLNVGESVNYPGLSLSPNDRMIAVCVRDFAVATIDMKKGILSNLISGISKTDQEGDESTNYLMRRSQFIEGGKQVIVGGCGVGRTVQVLDPNKVGIISTLQFHKDIFTFAYVVPGLLIVSFIDNTVECWKNIGNTRIFEWKLLWNLDEHPVQIKFSPRGRKKNLSNPRGERTKYLPGEYKTSSSALQTAARHSADAEVEKSATTRVPLLRPLSPPSPRTRHSADADVEKSPRSKPLPSPPESPGRTPTIRLKAPTKPAPVPAKAAFFKTVTPAKGSPFVSRRADRAEENPRQDELREELDGLDAEEIGKEQSFTKDF